MALPALSTSFVPSSITHNQHSRLFFRYPRCSSSSASAGVAASSDARFVTCALTNENQEIVRRSANWKPSVWDYGFVQSLRIDYKEEDYTEQVQRLKEEVRGLFGKEMNQVAKLEFIDVVQRLGLGYHFETEIKNALTSINNTGDAQLADDLYGTSLRFRLLRHHGYNVPQGETILDEARNFASKHLKDLNLNKVFRYTSEPRESCIRYAHPLEAKQSIHKKEVSNMARWWVDLGANKMTFFRDRLVEHYFWCCAMVFEPQYTAFREMTTKLTCMVTLIDDVYDVYGTLEELELLTDFLVRWDITDIDKLPPTIKNSYMALYNTTNEIGYWTMKELGINTIPHMRKVWADECNAYIKEVNWYNKGIKPTLKEYMDVSVDSIGGLIMLLGSYFLTTHKLTEEGLDYVSKIPSIMHSSAKILRLNNDLSTSSYELARGDNFKAMECYMNETGASEEATREHVRKLVHETWKKMNRDVFEDYPFPGFGPFLGACLNLARASQCFYQYGDGHGLPDNETKDHLVTALFEPVPLD
uniref:Terpene synthase n=1 Tax=Psidium guajava TaxID=120290 RepID=A0AA95ZBA6_PSIGU|nr:terpene synthase [Psidium guajava]